MGHYDSVCTECNEVTFSAATGSYYDCSCSDTTQRRRELEEELEETEAYLKAFKDRVKGYKQQIKELRKALNAI